MNDETTSAYAGICIKSNRDDQAITGTLTINRRNGLSMTGSTSEIEKHDDCEWIVGNVFDDDSFVRGSGE